VLAHNTLATAAIYIACGLNTQKCSLFIQSQVPEHTEMAWIFACITQLGWLDRMTQFKEKAQKFQTERASLGLYAYPVLMAADILLYQPDYVPVGEDQKQHVELTRDIAGSFNRHTKTQYFKLPEPFILKEGARIMSLRDGKKKMSKSDESDYSRINLTDDKDLIITKIKKAKTDSISEVYFDKESRPEISNLMNIYASIQDKSLKEIALECKGLTTAQFKEVLSILLSEKLTPIKQNFDLLMNDKAYLTKILAEGRDKACAVATKTLKGAKDLFGFIT